MDTADVIPGAEKRRCGGESETFGSRPRFGMDFAPRPWQIVSMPRRRCRDDEPAGLGYWLGSSVLRTIAHASLLAAAGMGMAAMLGSAAVSMRGVAVACAVGLASTAGAEAFRSKAILATRQERRTREDEIQRENAAVDAAIYAIEAEQLKADHVRRLLQEKAGERARNT